MIDVYKQTKNFMLISLAVLIIGSLLILELIHYVDIDKEKPSKINIIYEIEKENV